VRDPVERLRDILEACEHIERYSRRGKAAYLADELVRNWMAHHIQLIGEAARHVPEEVRSAIPDVPWAQIVGMRHILVHGYFEVDNDLVWTTVERDIPALRGAVERALRDVD